MFLQTSLFSKDGFGFTAQLCGSKLGSCPSSPEGKHCPIYSLKKSGVEWLTNPFLSPISSSHRSQLPSSATLSGVLQATGKARAHENRVQLAGWGGWVRYSLPWAPAWWWKCPKPAEHPGLWGAGPAPPPGEQSWELLQPALFASLQLRGSLIWSSWCHCTDMTQNSSHARFSSLNRGYFSQAWREEWCEPATPLLWRQRWSFPETDPTPGSVLMTSAFIFTPTSVWMWSVSSVQKSAFKNCSQWKTWS